MKGRWGIGLLGGMLIGVTTVALIPSRVNLAEADTHASNPAVVLKALETLHAEHPSLARARQLAEAYERGGQPMRGIQVLREAGQGQPLPLAERRLVRRLALAVGKPELALPVFEMAAKAGNRQTQKEFMELAIWAKRPDLALNGQRAYLARHPGDRQALASVRDLAIATGNRTEAIDFQRQLVQQTGEGDALQRLLGLHLQGNDPAGALADLLRFHPPDTVAWHDEATRLALWAGDRQKAREQALAAYALDPKPARALAVLADSGAHASPTLIALAEQVAADSAMNPSLRLRVREWLRFQKQDGLAQRLLDEDLVRYPDDEHLHAEKLDTLLAHQALDEAIAELKRYVAVRPTDREAQLKLAQVLGWRGQRDEAWQQYARVLGDDHKAGVKERQAWLAISRPTDDGHPLGLANLTALVRQQPTTLAYRRRLAQAHAQSGSYRAAIALQQHIVRSPQATAQDQSNLVRWLIWADDPEAATREAMRSRAPLPDDILKTLAQRAAARENWNHCGALLERVIAQHPRDLLARELLALALEARGQTAQAASAWQKRLQLGKADAGRWLLAAGLFSRSEQPEQALSLLRAMPVPPSPAIWRVRGFLAFRVAQYPEALAAFEHVREQSPDDVDLLLTLSAIHEKSKNYTQALNFREEALKHRPNDPGLLTQVAAAYVYGDHPEQGAGYVKRLAESRPRDGQALRCLADFYQVRDRTAARQWLDALHQMNEGDAQTWFRRAELEEDPHGAVANRAYARSVALGSQSDDRLDREAAAWSLERLERLDDAEQSWRRLALAFPQEPTAFARLARFHLARGDLEAAEVPLRVLERLQPAHTDTLILRADAWRLAGHPSKAATVLAQIPENDPQNAYVKAAEAMARHAASQFEIARGVAKGSLRKQPGSVDAWEVYRLVRDDAGWAVKLGGQLERYAGLDRQQMAFNAWSHLNPSFRMETQVRRVQWASGSVRAEQGGVGLQLRQGPWKLDGQASLARMDRDLTGTSLSPVAGVSLTYQQAGFQGTLDLMDQRWEETNQTLLLAGRERAIGASLRSQPRDGLSLGIRGALGQLSVPGAVGGNSTTLVTEMAWRVSPSAPITLYHQFRHRGWGLAGRIVGLPEQLNVQSVSASFFERLGQAQLEVQPGLAYDHNAQAVGVTAAGSFNWDLTPDTSLALNLNWSSRALAIGAPGDYLQSALELTCRL